MTKPAWKTNNVRNMLDNMTSTIYGRSASESIEQDICVSCGKPAVEFTDELSRREFAISGMCQKCQDNIFNFDPNDEV
jgi:hypothetical protein